MKKKNLLIGIIVILLIAGVFAYENGLFRFDDLSLVTTNTFVKPLWARLECARVDYQQSSSTAVPKSGVSVYCTENTEYCDFYATNIPSDFWTSKVKVRYKECNEAGTICDPYFSTVDIRDGVSQQLIKGNVPVGKKLFIYFERSLFNVNVEGTVSKRYYPFELYRFVGGSKFTVRSGSCLVADSQLSRIPSDASYPNPLTRTGGEGSKWINYVDDWAEGRATNVFTHPTNGEVYCTAARIYEIQKLSFKDGSVRKVDPQYKGTRADGDQVYGLGRLLGSVECCPNEALCGDDFKFKPAPVTNKECFSDIQCLNAGGPVPKSSMTYVKWSCQDNKCVEGQPVTVQCTSDSACSSGQICDLSTTNYGKCISAPKGEYCGNNRCTVDESEQSCPADCARGNDDQFWQSWQFWVLIGLVLVLIVVIIMRGRR